MKKHVNDYDPLTGDRSFYIVGSPMPNKKKDSTKTEDPDEDHYSNSMRKPSSRES